VYPKTRAIELAKITNLPVLAMPSDLAVNITQPVKSAEEPPVIALKEAPLEAVKPTGETVAITEVVEPPPVQAAAEVVEPAPVQTAAATSLPKTASLLPLFGLIGLLSLAAGLALSLLKKRPA